ncbi:uncharacterized protein G2W53_028966 [Senna tora]|uniref:Uncharacterized protein n=1 Tax=Senna tora TaxID=362788 RepID=A0A834T6V4_9FABA|nr:uncharacterized protein G2W53_028966 [Senna tora]
MTLYVVTLVVASVVASKGQLAVASLAASKSTRYSEQKQKN